MALLAFSGCGLESDPMLESRSDPLQSVTVSPAVQYDVSAPLRDMVSAGAPPPRTQFEGPIPVADFLGTPNTHRPGGDPEDNPGKNNRRLRKDTALQGAAAPSAAAPTAGAGFEGIGTGLAGSTVNSAPPDPNLDVGLNHIVQVVNTQIAVFSKTGALVMAPKNTNTLWAGFGGGCQTNNDGDAVVKYDRAAQRWIVSQFSVSTTPYLQCVAVSTTDDPTGSYNRYAFQYTYFNDYPKIGVWPDGYYITFNMFNGNTFAGGKTCAYDRASMLIGAPATQQCFDVTTDGGLLPSDVDGATPPPAGSPNYVLTFGTNALRMWKFHVDWATPANSTFTGPTTISVAAFTAACNGGGACIPQNGTRNKLDSLADRLMYRLAYRNLGDHESLVVNHSVTTNNSRVGVRWYEIRSPGATPSVFQQSTYAPDTSYYRWMGSIAMDASGNLALGYSRSSSTAYPAIAFTGRLASDPVNTLQAETVLVQGTGSQTGNLHRWGDYTSMAVDPADDCTFWYVNQYEAPGGSFNWRTRIGSFKYASCSAVPPTPGDFSIGVSPGTSSVTQPAAGSVTATYTVSTSNTGGGAPGTIDLTLDVLPTGISGSLNPTSVTAGQTSTLTLTVDSTAALGTTSFTVIGNNASASITHRASASLTVNALLALANGGFEAGSLSGWSASGVVLPVYATSPVHGGTGSARLGRSTAYTGDSILQQTITVPSGSPTLAFWYYPNCPDTLTYDQQQMQIRSTSGSILVTVLNVCDNAQVWKQKTFSLASYASQNVVLWFNVHDDGYASDPSQMWIDDVTVQ